MWNLSALICRRKNTFIERSKLVVTKQKLVNTNKVLSKTNVIEACTKERANTEWKIYSFKIVTVFLLYLEKLLWGAKTQYCQSHLEITTLIIV